MDIEERAEHYAREHTPHQLQGKELTAEQIRESREAIARAYLQGSAQTQADYAAHFRHDRRGLPD